MSSPPPHPSSPIKVDLESPKKMMSPQHKAHAIPTIEKRESKKRQADEEPISVDKHVKIASSLKVSPKSTSSAAVKSKIDIAEAPDTNISTSPILKDGQTTPTKDARCIKSITGDKTVEEIDGAAPSASGNNQSKVGKISSNSSANSSENKPISTVFKPSVFGSSTFGSASTCTGFSSVGAQSSTKSFAELLKTPVQPRTISKLFNEEDEAAIKSADRETDDVSDEIRSVQIMQRVPPPPPDDQVSGEETEDIAFSERGHLYSRVHDHEEWTESAKGYIRINRDKVTLKSRILMRADVVFRVILNMSITTPIPMILKQETYVQWVGSEDGRVMKFLCRFKESGSAEQFITTVKLMIEHTGNKDFVVSPVVVKKKKD